MDAWCACMYVWPPDGSMRLIDAWPGGCLSVWVGVRCRRGIPITVAGECCNLQASIGWVLPPQAPALTPSSKYSYSHQGDTRAKHHAHSLTKHVPYTHNPKLHACNTRLHTHRRSSLPLLSSKILKPRQTSTSFKIFILTPGRHTLSHLLFCSFFNKSKEARDIATTGSNIRSKD